MLGHLHGMLRADNKPKWWRSFARPSVSAFPRRRKSSHGANAPSHVSLRCAARRGDLAAVPADPGASSQSPSNSFATLRAMGRRRRPGRLAKEEGVVISEEAARVVELVSSTRRLGFSGWTSLALALVNPFDAALVEAEYPSATALPLKVGQQLVPCPQEFAAVVAKNPRLWASIARDSQPDCEAVRAF